jgi:serine/threonine protein kinase
MADGSHPENSLEEYSPGFLKLREKRLAEMKAKVAAASMAKNPGPKYNKLFQESLSNLGEGGFGSVRKVKNNTGFNRALKRISFNRYPENVFNKEVQIHSKIRSPYVATFVNSGKTNQAGYILMEYLPRNRAFAEGMMLDELIDEEEILENNPEFVTNIIENLLLGLDDIHEAGYLHLDIKPSNIWVSPEGDVKYIDFGISCENPCSSEHIRGTRGYSKKMSEGIDREEYNYDRTDDFYSLAITLEKMNEVIKNKKLNQYIIKLKQLEPTDDVMAVLGGVKGGRRKTRRRRNRQRKTRRRH